MTKSAWYNFIYTTDCSTFFKYYINGIYKDQKTLTATLINLLTKFDIINLCIDSYTGTGPFSPVSTLSYRNLTVFNSVFSQSQVTQLYNEQLNM